MKKILKLLLVLFLPVLAFWAYGAYEEGQRLNQPALYYGVEIADLEGRLDLTSQGRRIFYRAKPQLEEAGQFYQENPSNNEQLVVWGYYLAGSNQIHLLKTNKPELAGLEEVTAAHELLHAVWHSLSDKERTELGQLLRADYEGLKTPKFEGLMAAYEETEPGQFENELHSILGTEYGSLSPALEEHYAKYFQNREKILAYHAQYAAFFEEMEEKIKTLSADIEALYAEIEAERAAYDEAVESLDRAILAFNQEAEAGSFSSATAFQNQRFSLLTQQNQVSNQGAALNELIDRYNQKAEELRELSQNQQDFYESIKKPEKIPEILTENS